MRVAAQSPLPPGTLRFSRCFSAGQLRTVSASTDEKSSVLAVEDYWVSHEVLPVHVSMPGSSGTLREEGLKMHAMFGMIRSERDFSQAFNYAKNRSKYS